MCTNFLTSLLCFESFKKSGVVVNLVLLLTFSEIGLFCLIWFVLLVFFGGEGGGRGKRVFIWPYLLLLYKRTNCHISTH